MAVYFSHDNKYKENILLIENPPDRLTDDFQVKISGNTSFQDRMVVTNLIIKNEDIQEIDSFPEENDTFALVSIKLAGLGDD